MSFQVNIPPSVAARMAKLEEEAVGQEKKSREDWKKLKELEEARKAGTAPAMQDEEGKDINPHIPQYIMQAPWYFGANTPTLRHQRPQDEKHRPVSSMDQWFKKGVKSGPTATKFRKGACENCGALTHKKKDCLERPRKIGAQFTGTDIAPDEYIQPDLAFDFDGKRDRWNGYDPAENERVIEHFQKMEEAKRELKARKMDEGLVGEGDEAERSEDSEHEEDEDKYADDVDMPGQKFETKQRITVRNLRIREDTAKYLFNLNPNSAYYDPKTRSMRQNPYAASGKQLSELHYAGDNFVRWSGDAHNMATQQMFAWEAYEKGADVHLQADPTKLAILEAAFHEKKATVKTEQKDGILARYGGQEHLDAPPRQLLLAQSEDYTEYSRHGTVIKGQEKARVTSRFDEDVHINNHSSVWGSYWKDGQWGYKCCYGFIKTSYCTGSAGKEAVQDDVSTLAVPSSSQQPETEEPQLSFVQQHQERLSKKKKKKKEKKRKKKKKKKHHSSSEEESETDSEDEQQKSEKKLQEALLQETENQRRAEELLAMDERKRPYNSMYNVKAPTEEEMEAYRRKRIKADDPMAAFLGDG